MKFDIFISDFFDIDDGLFDNINSVYLLLFEGYGVCLKELYFIISIFENNLDYNDCSYSFLDLIAVNLKIRTYFFYYVYLKFL